MTTTKERPIIFSAPMVQAILRGEKTQTRRAAKPPAKGRFLPDDFWRNDPDEPGSAYLDDFSGRLRISCPYGVPGDRLWVREAFDAFDDPAAKKAEIRRKVWNEEEQATERWVVDYRADGNHDRIMDRTGQRRWKSAIYMPRWASRITLEVTGVRVQQVRDITRDDAFAEGVERADPYETNPELPPGMPACFRNYERAGGWFAADPVASFRTLWDSINGEKHPWESNPWVWAITFRRAKD